MISCPPLLGLCINSSLLIEDSCLRQNELKLYKHLANCVSPQTSNCNNFNMAERIPTEERLLANQSTNEDLIRIAWWLRHFREADNQTSRNFTANTNEAIDNITAQAARPADVGTLESQTERATRSSPQPTNPYPPEWVHRTNQEMFNLISRWRQLCAAKGICLRQPARGRTILCSNHRILSFLRIRSLIKLRPCRL